MSPTVQSETQGIRSTRPLPPVVRPALRFVLRTWSRFPKAPGYLFQVVERWGARLAAGPLECRLYNGARMMCDLQDYTQRQIYFRGAYEPVESYLVGQLLKPGMVVVDAGANIGQYTLMAATEVGCGGHVHAFEPVPKNFRRLEAHVVANGFQGRVRINMTALWHRTEMLRLHLDPNQALNDGAYTVGTPSVALDSVSATGIALDDYAQTHGLERLDFIKMDLEGAELLALKGAREALEKWRPMMLIEVYRRACQSLGYEPEEIWELLRPLGYMMWLVGRSPATCRPLSTLEGVDLANVIFHTNPLPGKVTTGWTYKSVLRFHRRGARTRSDICPRVSIG